MNVHAHIRHACIGACGYTHIQICVCIYIYTYTYTHKCTHVCAHMTTCVCMCLYIYICMYVCMYIGTLIIHIYIYTHTNAQCNQSIRWNFLGPGHLESRCCAARRMSAEGEKSAGCSLGFKDLWFRVEGLRTYGLGFRI